MGTQTHQNEENLTNNSKARFKILKSNQDSKLTQSSFSEIFESMNQTQNS